MYAIPHSSEIRTFYCLSTKYIFLSVICRPTEQEPQGWMGYFGQALKSSATYLPSQMTEMFNQGRAFATARLPNSGMHNVCALAT